MNQSDIWSGQFNLKTVFATMFRVSLGLGAIVFMIVTLIGLLGAVDAGYDAVNHFRIFIVAPGLVMALLALLIRARTTAAITMTALFVHAFAIVPEVYAGWRAPQVAVEPAKTPHRFKLVTFNMAFRHTNAERLRRFLENEKPDVLVLQEVSGKAVKIVDGLADLMPYRVHCMNERICDLALLSRHPITWQEIRRPSRAGLRLGLDPNRTRLIRAMIDIGKLTGNAGQTINVLTTHLGWPLPHVRQESQFRQLVQIISATDADRTILAGDFNSTPWSYAMKKFDRSLPMLRITRALHSWPTKLSISGVSMPYPVLPIDHVFIGRHFHAENVRRGPYLGSDHYPVIAELALSE